METLFQLVTGVSPPLNETSSSLRVARRRQMDKESLGVSVFM